MRAGGRAGCSSSLGRSAKDNWKARFPRSRNVFLPPTAAAGRLSSTFRGGKKNTLPPPDPVSTSCRRVRPRQCSELTKTVPTNNNISLPTRITSAHVLTTLSLRLYAGIRVCVCVLPPQPTTARNPLFLILSTPYIFIYIHLSVSFSHTYNTRAAYVKRIHPENPHTHTHTHHTTRGGGGGNNN